MKEKKHDTKEKKHDTKEKMETSSFCYLDSKIPPAITCSKLTIETLEQGVK